MRRLAVVLALAVTAGCASMPSVPVVGPAALLLGRADRLAREGSWEEAVASYDEYLSRFPEDSAAPRALETRDTLAATLTAQAELVSRRDEVTRLQAELAQLDTEGTRLREDRTRQTAEVTVLRDEVNRLRDERIELREELTRREDDLARTRQELAARQAEADRLRADIERLKQIDLKLERRR